MWIANGSEMRTFPVASLPQNFRTTLEQLAEKLASPQRDCGPSLPTNPPEPARSATPLQRALPPATFRFDSRAIASHGLARSSVDDLAGCSRGRGRQAYERLVGPERSKAAYDLERGRQWFVGQA